MTTLRILPLVLLAAGCSREHSQVGTASAATLGARARGDSAVNVRSIAVDSGQFNSQIYEDSTLIARRLWVAGPAGVVDIGGDGRTALVDSAGRLRLHDIASGMSQALVGSDSGWITTARLSRDGSRVYYSRSVPRPTWDTVELRVHDIKSGQDRLIDRFDGVRAYVEFGEETHDGTSLLVGLRAKDWSWQLAQISLSSGAVRSLKSLKWRSPGGPRLSPDGKFIAYDLSADERSNKRDVYLLAVDGSREAQITRTRENERVIGWTHDGDGLLFTRDRGGSRDLIRVAVSDGKRSGDERIVRRDVVSMEALRATGDRVYYMISNRPRELVGAAIPDSAATGFAQATSYLRTLDHTQWAVSPDGSSIVYFVSGENSGNGPISLFVRSLASGDERELELPLDYVWQLKWTTKPQEIIAIAQRRGRNDLYRIDLRAASATLIPGGLAPCGGDPLPIIPESSPNDSITVYLRQSAPGPVAELVACLRGGTGRVLYRGELLPPAYALSPDGRQVATIEHRGDSSVIHVLPTTTGAHTIRSFAGDERFHDIAGWTADGRELLLVRNSSEQGPELWRVKPVGDQKPLLMVRAARGRGARYVPALQRVFYTIGSAQPDELWALEPAQSSPPRSRK